MGPTAVLTSLICNRTHAVWLLLTGATLLSWTLGHGHAAHIYLSLSLIAIAVVKIRLVGLYFMELSNAPTVLRTSFEVYCAALGITLASVYLLT